MDRLNIIQLNVNHCAAAQSLLAQTAADLNVDIMLQSEPCCSPNSGNSSLQSSSRPRPGRLADAWYCLRENKRATYI